MSIFEQLTNDMKVALKASDKERLSVIRLMRGYLKNEAINKQKELSEEDEIDVLASAAKKRKESIQAYQEAGRQDLAEKESRELQVIQEYLPKPLTKEEVEAIVKTAIEETGAESIKDIGKVMALVMQQTKGRADGKEINAMVRTELGT